MAVNYVNVNGTNRKNIYVGNTRIDKIYANNALVYQRTPNQLFPVNSDNRDVVGGYKVVAMEHLGSTWGYFYGANRGNSVANDTTALLYNPLACVIQTTNKINFSDHQYKSITIKGNLQIGGWGYDDYKWANNNTYAEIKCGLTDTIAQGNSIFSTYSMYSNGNPVLSGYRGNNSALKPDTPQPISFTITNLPKSGSYYLYIADVRFGVSGNIKFNITSITGNL